MCRTLRKGKMERRTYLRTSIMKPSSREIGAETLLAKSTAGYLLGLMTPRVFMVGWPDMVRARRV